MQPFGMNTKPHGSKLDARFTEVTERTIRGCATAKLNLFLEVTERRDDGYHELVSVFHEIDLADKMTVELCPEFGCDNLSSTGAPIQGKVQDNLAMRAVTAFRRRHRPLPPVRLRLHKNIPTGAGLGGGSSNAAFVLSALNRLCGHPLSQESLCQIGASLGADVPFFLFGNSAVCRGIGELVEPIRWPTRLHFILAQPDFSLSTARVYDELTLTNTPRNVMPFVSQLQVHNDGGGKPLRCFNRLQEAVFRLAPEVRDLCRALRDASSRTWTVTGSGSVIFSPFSSELGARRVLSNLTPQNGTKLTLVRSFSRDGANEPPLTEVTGRRRRSVRGDHRDSCQARR